jgi:hypothetical protein
VHETAEGVSPRRAPEPRGDQGKRRADKDVMKIQLWQVEPA